MFGVKNSEYFNPNCEYPNCEYPNCEVRPVFLSLDFKFNNMTK